VRKKKPPRRRPELSWIAGRIKQLSQKAVPTMDGETQLRNQVRQHLVRQGRYSFDGPVLRSIDKIIDSYGIEMRSEISRRYAADEVEIGELEVQLDGLVAQYAEEERYRADTVGQLSYQARSALWVLEDRDISMPAGRDGVAEPGYQHGNPGEIARRSLRSLILLYIVLGLAMLGDIITFRQVVERVVNDTAVLPMVLAITATTTYVAHLAGEAVKAAQVMRRRLRKAYAAWLFAATWLGTGIGAFVFRLLAPAPVAGNILDDFQNSGNVSSSGAEGSAVLSAVLLLLLYVVTGAIAAAAGYRRPRVEVHQFRWSDRRKRRAEPRLARLRGDVVEAEALRRQLAELRASWAKQHETELGRCDAATNRVKAEAEMMARHVGELTWLQRVLGGRARSAGDPSPGRSIDEDTIAVPHQRPAVGRARIAYGRVAGDDGSDEEMTDQLAHRRPAEGRYDSRPNVYGRPASRAGAAEGPDADTAPGTGRGTSDDRSAPA
jgi:hypothetical protein